MLNPTKHRKVLIAILRGIYNDSDLRTSLGFKGGTAAYLFYDLPRVSVDLDFDLLDGEKKEAVFEKMKALLGRVGQLRDAWNKRNTLFFLMSYEKEQRTIKVEISKRKGSSRFEARSYLGLKALVMREEDMAAGKLAALLTRRKFAMRDAYDLWWFLQQDWGMNEEVLKEKTDLFVAQALRKALVKVKELKSNQLLQGLGELLDEKQKVWVKEKLIDELVFQLRLRRESLK